MAFFSLVSENEPDQELGELFSKSSSKTAPEYDYSEVDAKKSKKKDEAEDFSENDANEDESDEEEEKEDAKVNEVKLKTDRMAQVKKEDSKKRIIDEEKEKRTIFIGNLNVNIKKKHLKKLFSKFGKIETVRFRCASRPDLKTTKKVAVIKQTFHEQRDNICAYVRMSTVEEAEACCSLNGTVLDGFTIRVDMALKNKAHDNKKSIFLGNLHFNTKEDDVRKLFSKCGNIENVRLIRDGTTGMGKGFGYVNFTEEESVNKAMRLNNQEISGRKVRVSKSVRKPKSAVKHKAERKIKNRQNRSSERKVSSNDKENSKKDGKFQSKYKKKDFQGVNTNRAKKNVKKSTKKDRKNKTMAKILSK